MAANVVPLHPVPSANLDRLLSRLEKVKRAGRGYTACCPAHSDRNASLSVSEADNGSILLHCFAACQPADVLGAIGLSLGDLFPERLRPATPQERKEALRHAQEAKWMAALDVAAFEAGVAEAAASMMANGEALAPDALERLKLAAERLGNAWEAFRVRPR